MSGWNRDMSAAPRDRDFPALYRGELIVCRWSEDYQQFVGVNVRDLRDFQTVSILTNEWAGVHGPDMWLDVAIPNVEKVVD